MPDAIDLLMLAALATGAVNLLVAGINFFSSSEPDPWVNCPTQMLGHQSGRVSQNAPSPNVGGRSRA